ncbi:MAG TPA: alpha-2-macroglobulin family protein [Thermoanaerobaculia bacterium]
MALPTRRPLPVLACLWAAAAVALAVAWAPPGSQRARGAGVAPKATPAPTPATMRGVAPTWKEIDRLIEEQKLAEASEKADAILRRAIAAKDEAEWTRALVRSVQLRTGLHGYETAVRFLREQPWPDGLLGRTTLELFYAHALTAYAQAYSWEIAKRERVESPDSSKPNAPVDLKAWTRDQILAEARRSYLAVWKRRTELSALPVDRLSEYVRPNNYPRDIRGTLRDAVSYLFVELLADASLWSPEQSHGAYQLSLARLLETDGRDADVRLADPQAHPAEQIAEILGDLESWHFSAGQREAALEARLERLRRLHAVFTGSADRAAIRADLEKRLPSFRAFAWWAMGMAELAEFREAEEAPDRLVRARAAAQEGQRAYPQSVGGRRCADRVAAIEAPDFQLASMSADGPDRRSIELTHKNLAAVHFRAYALDLENRLGTATDYNLLPAGNEVLALVRSARPAAAWTAALPATPDFLMHRTFVTPPLAAPGVYVVIASFREDFAETRNRLNSVTMVVGDLVLLTRPESSAVEARVVTGDGRPVEGADVWLYAYDWGQGRRHHRVEGKRSDASGLARFAYTAGRTEQSFFLVARRGKDYALDPSYLSLGVPRENGEETAALVYTDRSIYRPQQKVLWKVVAYRGRVDLGRLRTFANASVTLTLRDANNQAIESKTATTNAYGSAAGEFTIPAGRALGRWRLESSIPGSAFVQIEEYKRPTFEVKWKDPETALRLNRPAELTGTARYYFGLPVAGGSVSWRVTRTPEYPWWWWWYGSSGGYLARGGSSGGGQGQIVAQGQSALDADGTFRIRFTPEADERLGKDASAVTYRYEAVADATDEGGETRSDTRGFRLGFTAVEAAIQPDTEFFRESSRGAMTITRSDLDGVPRAGRATWRLTEIVQPKETPLPADLPVEPAPGERLLTPGDRLRPRWSTAFQREAILHGWPEGRERAHGELAHDEKGKARLELPELPAGAWRLHYETTDAFGAKYETTRDFLVAGKTMPARLPGVLIAERASVPVGETARFLLGSGLTGQTLFVETLRDGKVIARNGAESSGVLEIPVTEESRGGFSVRLSLVRDHQFIEITQSVFVPWSDKELDVAFATFRDKIRPGAKETWRVTVKAPEGSGDESRTAELLAYMYDRSLDAFVPHSPPGVLSVYPNHTAPGELRASLSQASTQWVVNGLSVSTQAETLYGDALKFFDAYGIGGPGVRSRMAMKSAAVAENAAAPYPASAPANAREEGQAGGLLGGVPQRQDALEKKEGDKAAAGSEAAGVPLRSNFAETAFWRPQLLTGPDGSAVIEFEVPDSVTSWNVWVHAVTRDLKGGSIHRETQSVKDLMVRPYVPRFLREGDAAQLKVVVNNASSQPLAGEVTLDILDTETNASVLDRFGLTPEQARRPFSAKAGAGADVAFALAAPKRVGSYAIRATAVSGAYSDGELRPVPVLPGRMQLAQSRFTALREGDRKTLTFADMTRGDDPSRVDEQLVVTVDAQLFYSVLNALPYLVNYPYECTEQTLNRFVSTGIVSSLFRDYPAVARMAQELSKRETPLETWAAVDPNRKMTLEETPWLVLSRGGDKTGAGAGYVNVLDPRVAQAERESALARLRKAQTSIGAFPWWPGGPPSPYMTLYILYGLAKASEFGVDVPKDIVQRGWQYLARHFREDYATKMVKEDCCWEFLTFLNYVATCYPDPSWMNDALKPEERKAILAFCFKHWKEHTPYLKGYLALTLKRSGRPSDADLVWASVMDSAKTDPDRGTYWAPEDRAWLWYNDTIETQAFALRTLMELSPDDARRHGLVQWLFLNKKLNQWKSTRATAEVIYSLIWYLRHEGALSVREEATVEAGGQRTTFTFEPDRYTGGHNQVVVPGEKLDPKRDASVSVAKAGKGLAFASATWHFSTEKLPVEERGDFFSVSRKYFRREATAGGFVLKPLSEGAPVAAGDEIEVQLSLRAKHAAEYVHLRDPRAAGTEPENVLSRYKYDLGIVWYEETRDSGSNFFFEQLPAGEYTFRYRVRANMAGTYRVGPATVQSMYAPEFNAYSSGAVLTIR